MRTALDFTRKRRRDDYGCSYGRSSSNHPPARAWSNRARARDRPIIDTGFDGWLSLPSSLIVLLSLVWRQRGRALLADGRESVFDIYQGTVIWDGQDHRIPVHEAETTPLIGMSLLHGYELTIQTQAGGKVTVRALSQAKSG